MTIKTAIELEVKQPNLKGFKAQLRELTLEAQQAVLKFGEFSPEAVAAAQRVAQLKDQIDDFNDRVAAINPDKFAQLNTVVSSVVNGFQAAQGAMVLLGGTTESVEKTFVKLQAAMALSQGLEGLGRVQQQLKQIISSASTLQKVMAGTLGVVVLVVANFERLVGIIPGLKTLGNFLTEIGFKISDFFGLGYREAAQYKLFKANNDLVIAEIEKRIAILSTQENTELQVFEQRKKLAQQELLDLQEQLKSRIDISEEEKQELILQQQKLNDELEIIDAERSRFIKEQNKIIAENNQKHNDELVKQQLDNKNKIQNIDTFTFKSQVARANTEHQIRIGQLRKQNDEIILELDKRQREEEEQFKNNQEQLLKIQKHYETLRVKNNEEFTKQLSDEDKRYGNQQIEFDKLVKNELYNNSIQLANAVIALAGEQSKLGKGIALATIAADTGVALTSALRNTQSPTPDNVATGGLAGVAKYIGLAATILTNVKRARDIVKSGNTNLGGSVGGGGFTSNIGGVAPSMVTGSSLPQDMGAGKVYVLEGDIRRTQQRVNGNQRVSTVE
jgi:hypothetical protein